MKRYVIPAALILLTSAAAASAQTRPAQRPHHTVNRPSHNTNHRPVHRDVNVTVNHNHWNGNVYRGPRVAVGHYRWPHGYHYHRWVVGGILPRAFLASAYYYAGYAALGLAPPPPHYQWVRYGPDLLLVDTRNGRVSDVRYGVFT